MFKHYFELLDGIDIYPIFSLIVFLIFFIIVILYILKTDKSKFKEISNLPLEGDNNSEI
ncbi:MAG: CcoQ/FixQ family Cbb3-type cytochrome c oxidase assembly chaperone [Bacteroidetes bacterium]|nr:CcoQ/FixQ family Cbb3-type cytochrome c oxidase assembly chaperone [Bacteroidota bacterium]